MVDNVNESDELKDIPVIAPVAMYSQDHPRLWVAKNTGKPVYLLPPDTTVDMNERQAIRQTIERDEKLVTTPMTFAELMADYLGHHEKKALDLYGKETDPNTRGILELPRARITELIFIGKETILQEELERGLMSKEEVEADRVLIQPENDPIADLVLVVLRLMTKAELRGLRISRYMADRIKDTKGHPDLGDSPAQTRLLDELVKHLQERSLDEIGGTNDEDALRAFVANRNRLLELWREIKPGLSKMSTQELMKIADCSRGTAKNIKYGRIEPPISTIKKIVAAYSNGYNSIGE